MRSTCVTLLAGLGMVAGLFLPSGCRAGKSTSMTPATRSAGDAPEAAAEDEVVSLKGGAQVWSENCMRCHNLRRPRQRSDREWAVIAHHMRVRANLLAEEHRLILRFLQSAN